MKSTDQESNQASGKPELSEALLRLTEALARVGANVRISSYRALDAYHSQYEASLEIPGQPGCDLFIHLARAGEPRHVDLAALDFRKWTRARAAGHASVRGLFVAYHVSAGSRLLCEERGLDYIDLSGDSYRISLPHYHVERIAPPVRASRSRGVGPLFSARRTQVIRALLNDPHRDWHQNALARESRISIGTVNALVDRLEREGFVRRVGVGRRHQILRLIRPGELLDRWADHWREVKRVRHRFFHRHSSPEQLMRELRAAATELYREGLLLGQQRILLPSPGDTSRLALTPASEFAGHKVEPVAYTGLAGAHLLHGHVSFAVIEAYVPIDAAVLARRLGMLAADEGPNVVLIAPPDEGIFHCTVHRAGLPVVCLPQLYVDLVAGGGRAQGEAAPRVREDLLKAGEGRHG